MTIRRPLPAAFATLALLLALSCSTGGRPESVLAWHVAPLRAGEPAPFSGWLRKPSVPVAGVEAVYLHKGESAPFEGTIGRVLHRRPSG